MKKNRSRTLFDAAQFASMLRLLSLIILCVIVLTSPGCSCSSSSTTGPQTEAERKAEEERLAKVAAELKKKKKPPFDDAQLSILPDMIVEKPEKKEEKPVAQPANPNQPLQNGEKPIFNYYKVRHWASAIERRKSNDEDLPGMELHSTLTGNGGSPTLENQSYTVEFTRPVALAKGKEKYLEYQFFAVPGPSTFLQSELADRRSGRVYNVQSFPMSKMDAHTYHFVILTKDQSKYLRWSKLDVMTRPAEMGSEHDFRVKMPEVKKMAPLPTYFQGWTSTAALVWDGIDPSLLNMEQQNAMRDWLHWGGLLIVNGPTSVDLLKGSFLDLDQEQTLMPYIGTEARAVTQSDISLINSYWSKCEQPNDYNNLVPLKMTKPWNGLNFKKHKLAQKIDETAGLVLARDVGRGRVVVTGFSMAQSDFHNWQGLDGFINGALMGNGPRRFVAIPNSAGMYSIVKQRIGEQTYFANSYLNTRFRILTRDWSNQGFNNESEENVISFQKRNAFESSGNTEIDDASMADSGIRANLMSAASWNDTREISAAARDSLGVASGINLPDVSFVIVLLIVYLGVLVVLNYGVFKVLGRVEYAWFAAPVIAIVGSLAVIKLAQLDIGFVRSQTEVAVLECHANYPRAHLTRYTALYSSLSTNYEMKLDDPGGVALPFAIQTRSKSPTGRFGATGPTKVTYSQDDQKIQLSGFEVSSNSMSMIHSEQMIDLKGGIRYDEREENRGFVQNDTAYQFENVGVVRRTKAGKLQTGWIGTLLPGGKTIVEYSTQSEANQREKPILKINTPPQVYVNPRFRPRQIAAPVDETVKDEATKAAEELEKEKKAATDRTNYSPLFTQWSKYFAKRDPKARDNETPIPLANLLQLLSTSHKDSLMNGESRMIALIPRQLPGMTISPAAAQSDRSITIAYVQLTSGSQWVHQRDIDSRWQAKQLNPQDDKNKIIDLDDSVDPGEAETDQ